MVFGKAIRHAQQAFLKQIKPNTSILILGGGTGYILGDIFNAQPNCSITYVDASLKMIEKAKARGWQQVTFIHGTHDDIPKMRYDVIVTNFFLDMFTTNELNKLITLLNNYLNDSGIWLATDFTKPTRVYHKFLLFMMYTFFRITCGIRTSLPDWQKAFEHQNMKLISKRYYFQGFICAQVLGR